MIKKHGILYAIRYYCIIQFILFGVVLYYAKDFLFGFFCTISKINERTPFYKVYEFLIPILLFMLWFMVVFSITREKLYFVKTGRKYGKDFGKYKRTYHELVEYFEDADPHKLDTSNFPIQSWKDTKGLIFGMDDKKLITLPSNSECNIAIFGPPGSGKTSGVGIINAMCFDGSVLAVDVKGDLYNYVAKNSKRKILRFCPDHPNALKESCHFDPLAGM